MTLFQWTCISIIVIGSIFITIKSKILPLGPLIILPKKERKYSKEELRQHTLRAMRVGKTAEQNKRTDTIETIHTEWFENNFQNQ